MDTSERLDKPAWRSRLLADRAGLDAKTRAAESEALTAASARLATEHAGTWVAAYVPVGDEPGSPAIPEALRSAGARVLLPVTGPPGPLQWAEYTGTAGLRRARYGLLEPDGERLPAAAIARAELILVPALAVDRRGARLGRGAGYYDRTLTSARIGVRLIAVLRDDELVERLPEDAHDLRMGWALTPGGLHRLGRRTDQSRSSA